MQRCSVDAAVQQACALAAQALRGRPSALVTDLDGTLSPIVSVPEQAAVLPGCRRALDRLRQRLDLVAVISGRPAAEAKRLLGLDGIVYLGNHGLDPWIGAERAGVPCGGRGGPPGRESVLAALDELKEALAGRPGLRFEDKGATISIHYRSASDRAAARSQVLAAAAESVAVHDLAVGEGKMVVELRPSHWAGKGDGLKELVQARGLRGLVYMGDDRPDLHAFEVLDQLRQDEALLTVSIGVVGPESPPELAGQADVVLAGPEQAEVFLEELAEALS